MKRVVLIQLFLLIIVLFSVLLGEYNLPFYILGVSGGVFLGAVLKREDSGDG